MKRRYKILIACLVVPLLGATYALQRGIYRTGGGQEMVAPTGTAIQIQSGAEIDIEAGGSLKIAGTAIASTAAELNLLNTSTVGTIVASKVIVADSGGRLADADLDLNSTNALSLLIGDVNLLEIDDAAISGNAGATDAVGQDAFIETQDAGATPTVARAGGALSIKTGDGASAANAVACGDGGDISVVSGAGGVNTGAATGQVGGAGGALTMAAGAGGATNSTGAHAGGAGGAVSIASGIGGTQTGAAQTGGAGGAVAITGAAGGATTVAAATGGAGATVKITAGAGGADGEGGSGTGGAGGDVIIDAGAGGAGATAGLGGLIINRDRVMYNTPTPETATNTASLTDAQILSGILVCTPTGAATYTMRTGTQIEAALSGSLANNDSFDLTVINIGGTGDIITMAAADGVTFVGSLTIDDPGADINSSGTFRFRRTGANVFVGYRIN